MRKIITILFIACFCQLSTAQQNTKSNSENFNTFLKKFNDDQNFQLSRIKFPLKVKIINDNFEDIDASINQNGVKQNSAFVDVVITQNNYKRLKLDDKNREFKQKIVLKQKTAVIQHRGIDNGIFADYIFELRNNKWYLKTWEDMST